MKPDVPTCSVCPNQIQKIFTKFSEPLKKDFEIFQCNSCGLWQIYPLPDKADLIKLYEKSYFSKRTSRGYNDYTSDDVKKTIYSTFVKNLTELGFYDYEKIMESPKYALEIGAAAGYFTEYLKDRKWNSTGMDVSKEMTEAAKKRGVEIIHGDFLLHNFSGRNYDLITLWATLEHLPDPQNYLIKMSKLLKLSGHIYISTAHTGFWARIYGKKWRYLNVPEHVFYFNRRNLKILLKKCNLKINRSFTYGSGFTAKPSSSFIYKFFKIIFDKSAKLLHLGDMIVMDIVRDSSRF